jgi:hypothetical protein
VQEGHVSADNFFNRQGAVVTGDAGQQGGYRRHTVSRAYGVVDPDANRFQELLLRHRHPLWELHLLCFFSTHFLAPFSVGARPMSHNTPNAGIGTLCRRMPAVGGDWGGERAAARQGISAPWPLANSPAGGLSSLPFCEF